MKQIRYKKVVKWKNEENIYVPLIIIGLLIIGRILGTLSLIVYIVGILVYAIHKIIKETRRKTYWVKEK